MLTDAEIIEVPVTDKANYQVDDTFIEIYNETSDVDKSFGCNVVTYPMLHKDSMT